MCPYFKRTCKPGSVVDAHLSSPAITDRVERPYPFRY